METATDTYRELMTEPRSFVRDKLGHTTAPIVYCDVDVVDSRLVCAAFVSDQPLPGYQAREGVFTKELSSDDIARFQKPLLDSFRSFGRYRNLKDDPGFFNYRRFRMDGIWPSVKMLQEALGVDSEYVFVRPAQMSPDPATTDKAVIVHELTHNFNSLAGHKVLEDLVKPFVIDLLEDKMPYFYGVRNMYFSDNQFLGESLSYIAEFAYLKKERPDLWAKQEAQLNQIVRKAPDIESWHIIPYIVLTAEREEALFEELRKIKI